MTEPIKQLPGGRVQLNLTVEQVKGLYLALFRQLRSQAVSLEFDDFDEDDLLMALQVFLQGRAAEAGVDATIHTEWERFLGIDEPIPCDVRHTDRQPPDV